MPNEKVALILGAGFSCEAGLPYTGQVVSSFLEHPVNGHLPKEVEEEVSCQLMKFWKYAFNYNKKGATPSLEDHFTVLDLAANAGRNIGSEYTPKKLRAIRRLSIHRIFQILDARYHESDAIRHLLSLLNSSSALTIVSTNWDRVVENHLNHLDIPFWYGFPVESLSGEEKAQSDLSLLMLHGSANWVYCDSCRRMYAQQFGKGALQSYIYITRDDFRLLCGEGHPVVALVNDLSRHQKSCPHCESRLGARLATFSYRKEISTPQFQMAWQQAFSALRDSEIWLFIGYSLPDADFEFRHLLKSAEKAASKGTAKKLQVILRGDDASCERFRRFFGIADQQVYQGGLAMWMRDYFPNWCRSLGITNH